MSCITIYTDASYCNETKTGGWACWIKYSPGETALFSGAFKRPVHCVNSAELQAIANALAIVYKSGISKKTVLVVVTDSQASQQQIAFAQGTKKKVRKKPCNRLQAIAKHILKLVPNGCELRVNKVRAHCKSDGARSYVNNLVDKASRKAMKEKRKTIIQKQGKAA